MRFNHYWGAIALFIFVVGVGIFIPLLKKSGNLYVYVGENRVPAAIDRSMNFSHLEGSHLRNASQQRLSQEAKLLRSDEGVGVVLGNFALKGERGQPRFSCHVFNRIEVVLRAESEERGVAEAGEVPKLVVEGPCRLSEDFSHIQPLWIPMQQIVAENHGDMELNFMGEQSLTVKVSGVRSFWPRDWQVESFRLFQKGQYHQGLLVDQQALNRYRDQSLSFTW